MRLDQFHRLHDAVFIVDGLTKRPRALADFITARFDDRLSQSFNREMLYKNRFWTRTYRMDSPRPKRLVGHEWNDHLRNARTKTSGNRPCAAVMDEHVTARQQPIMRSGFEIE